jgi:hypothetical protein
MNVTARKNAELLSLIGAAIVGVAIGVWLATPLRPFWSALLAVGLIVHAVGMSVSHRIDRIEAPLPRIWQTLYLACWMTIAGVLLFLLFS